MCRQIWTLALSIPVWRKGHFPALRNKFNCIFTIVFGQLNSLPYLSYNLNYMTIITVDSRNLEDQGTLNHFEISVPRHIRFAELRKSKSNYKLIYNHYQELSYYRNCHSDYRYSILDRLRLIPIDRSSHLCSWCEISSVSHTPTVLLQFRLNHVWMHFRILDPIYTGLGPS